MYAFCGCSSLTSVVIGDSVTSIGYEAFYDTSLKNIYISDIASWCNISGLSNIMNYGSVNKELYLNKELITELVIPDSVPSIGSSACRHCRSLTNVVIPDRVTTIGDYAFVWCSSLTSVIIGDSVTTIGNYAFYNYNNLTVVYYKGTASDWDNMSIVSNNSNLISATRYYYSDSEDVAMWWHYDENGNIVHA